MTEAIEKILNAPSPYSDRTVYDLLKEAVSLWGDEYSENVYYDEYTKAKNTETQLLEALEKIAGISE